MSYPCTSCGLCCKQVGPTVIAAKELVADGGASPFVKEVAAFPYEFDITGTCVKLGPDNKCTVYQERPDICSVDRTWLKHFWNREYKKDYYQKSAQACNRLIIENKLDLSKYIVIV